MHTVRFEFNAFTNTYYKTSNRSGIGLGLLAFFVICLMAVTAIMTCLMPLLLSLKQQIKKMGLLDEIEGLDLGGVQIALWIHGFLSHTPGWIPGLQDLLA